MDLQNSSAENNNDQDNMDGTTLKSCRCVLCGEEFVASSPEECMAHMEACQAFGRVHPTSGETNPDGVYPLAGAVAAAVNSSSEFPAAKEIISQQQQQQQQQQPEHIEENITNPFN